MEFEINKIRVTRTSAGYCSTYQIGKNPQRYVTPRPGNPDAAGYTTFPVLLTRIVRLPRELYEGHIDFQIDHNPQVSISKKSKT